MLFRISWRSFFRQSRNYLVYFVCMMTAVMIFYSFSALTFDQLLTKQVRQDVQIEVILGLGNRIVAVVVLLFMLSTNHFFLVQRQKEIAVYQLLGLRRRRLVGHLLLQTLLLNLLSLVAGIFMGIVFSKLFSMILTRIMGVTITSHFFISWRSIITTIAVFLLAMGLIAIQMFLYIWRKRASVLFDEKYHFASTINGFRPVRMGMGVVGIVMILTGYYLAFYLHDVLQRYLQITSNFSAILWVPLIILGLCVVGTYIFFECSLPLLLRLFSRPGKYGGNGLRLVALNNVSGYLRSSWRNFSLLTIVTAIAISLIGGSIGAVSLEFQTARSERPTDFQVNHEQEEQLKTLLSTHGGRVLQQETITFKLTAVAIKSKMFGEENFENNYESLINMISLSDYNAFLTLVPQAPTIELLSNQTVLFDASYNVLQGINSYDRTLTLPNDEKLQIGNVYPDYFGDNAMRYGLNNVMVVTDEVFAEISGSSYQLDYLNTAISDRDSFAKILQEELPVDWIQPIYYEKAADTQPQLGKIQTEPFADTVTSVQTFYRLNQINRYSYMRLVRRQVGIILFVSVFVGIIVLVTTSSSLIVRQFSNAENDRRGFQLLAHLGYTKQQIRKIVYYQNFWIFAPTAILATLHAVFAINTITQFFASRAYWFAYLFAGFALFVYLLAYLVTVRLCLRIIEE